MKRFLAFIFSLFMAFIPVHGMANAVGGPTGQNKVACDKLYEEMVGLINRAGERCLSCGNAIMTKFAVSVLDRLDVDYCIQKVNFSNGNYRTSLLLRQTDEDGIGKLYVCDFWAACFNYLSVQSGSNPNLDKAREWSYEMLFADFENYRKAMFDDQY